MAVIMADFRMAIKEVEPMPKRFILKCPFLGMKLRLRT